MIKSGFTFIELIIVIVVIGLLTTIAVAAYVDLATKSKIITLHDSAKVATQICAQTQAMKGSGQSYTPITSCISLNTNPTLKLSTRHSITAPDNNALSITNPSGDCQIADTDTSIPAETFGCQYVP